MVSKRRDKRRRAHRLGSIEREILQELSGSDLLYGFLLSARSSRRMYRLARERAAYRQRRKRAIARLIDERFILASHERLSISEAGKGAVGLAIEKTRTLLKEEIWDGKWRLVIFDIPEKYATLRNRVRTILKKAGFIQFQQSVWLFPHECAELASLIKKESDLAPYILYGVLESIEGDTQLKKAFKL